MQPQPVVGLDVPALVLVLGVELGDAAELETADSVVAGSEVAAASAVGE